MGVRQRAWIQAGLAFSALVRPTIAVGGERMDPAMAALVRAARRMAPKQEVGGGLDPEALDGLRRQIAAAPALLGIAPDPRVRVEAAVAGGVPARRYHPPGQASGTLVFLHGGGFIMGGLDSHDVLCRTVAAGAGVRVLSVGYRLAPEHPYPAAVEDALAAWDGAAAHEPGPVAVAGDSAGGNLAAVVAGERRGAGGPALQGLLYPVVDMVGEYVSIARFGSGFLLTKEGLDICADAYMPAGVDRAGSQLSPLRGDLRGVAPAVIVTAGFDPLRDQGPAYAAALAAAGVKAELCCETGLVHGFADFAGVVPAAREAVGRWTAAVGRGMAVAAGAKP